MVSTTGEPLHLQLFGIVAGTISLSIKFFKKFLLIRITYIVKKITITLTKKVSGESQNPLLIWDYFKIGFFSFLVALQIMLLITIIS